MGQGSSISNDLIININNTNFKSFCCCEKFSIPSNCMDIVDIIDYNTSILLGNVYTISTPIGTSNSGQTLTGNKLLISGKVCLDVSFLPINDLPIYKSNFVIPFCTFIVVPQSVTNIDCSDILYTIENIYLEIIDNRDFIACINLLVEI